MAYSVGDILVGTSGNEMPLSATGRTVKISFREQSYSEQTLDGTTKKDILSIKRTFIVDYSDITNDDLKKLITIYQLKQKLSLKYYTGSGVYESYTVHMSSFDMQRLTHLGGGWWTGVSFTFDEV